MSSLTVFPVLWSYSAILKPLSSRIIPIQAYGEFSSANPATSPALRPLPSNSVVAVDSGPTTRWVSEFRAHQKSGAGSECRRRYPGRSESDHFVSLSRPPEIGGRQRMQTEIPRPLRKRPLRVVGHVIPLPDYLKLRPREIVGALVRRRNRDGVSRVRLHPDGRRPPQVARHAEVRPSILPSDRRERSEPADGVVILHRETPPLARLRRNDAALVQVEIPALARIRGVDLHRLGISASAAFRSIALADSEALLRTDGLYLPRSRQPVRPGALHGHVSAGNGADDVVFAVDLIEVRTFAHTQLGVNQDAVRARNKSGEGLVQFHDPDRR